MPRSWPLGKEWIRARLEVAGRVARVLDVGVGAGTYSRLFRPVLPDAQWIGIEAWEPYVQRFDLEAKYDRIVVGDVRRLDLAELGCFDLCFCGDVIEHMAAEEAGRLARRLLDCARLLFVSVPLGACPQGAVNGKPFERHVVDDYSDASLRHVLPEVVDGAIDRLGRKAVGVYAMSRDPPTVAALLASAETAEGPLCAERPERTKRAFL